MKVMIDGVEYIQAPPVDADDRTHNAALAVRFDADCGDNITVRDYLFHLLKTLWAEGEGFSGKRPFGNSGWDYEIITPLWRAGFIKGNKPTADNEMNLSKEHQADAESYVFELIESAIYGAKAVPRLQEEG